jgi:hypothetical protein
VGFVQAGALAGAGRAQNHDGGIFFSVNHFPQQLHLLLAMVRPSQGVRVQLVQVFGNLFDFLHSIEVALGLEERAKKVRIVFPQQVFGMAKEKVELYHPTGLPALGLDHEAIQVGIFTMGFTIPPGPFLQLKEQLLRSLFLVLPFGVGRNVKEVFKLREPGIILPLMGKAQHPKVAVYEAFSVFEGEGDLLEAVVRYKGKPEKFGQAFAGEFPLLELPPQGLAVEFQGLVVASVGHDRSLGKKGSKDVGFTVFCYLCDLSGIGIKFIHLEGVLQDAYPDKRFKFLV